MHWFFCMFHSIWGFLSKTRVFWISRIRQKTAKQKNIEPSFIIWGQCCPMPIWSPFFSTPLPCELAKTLLAGLGWPGLPRLKGQSYCKGKMWSQMAMAAGGNYAINKYMDTPRGPGSPYVRWWLGWSQSPPTSKLFRFHDHSTIYNSKRNIYTNYIYESHTNQNPITKK